MTGWEAFWACYLLVGALITICAHFGFEPKFGRPMPWLYYPAGLFFWPFILILAGGKK